MTCATSPCATSMSRAQTQQAAPANRRAAQPTSSRSPARPRPAVAMASTFSEWIIRRAMAPAFATSFMRRIWPWLTHVAALSHLESSGPSQRLNCGYSRGFSVLEVIKAVERVSGRALTVRDAPRCPRDVTEIVADCRRLRSVLNWTPRHDDIDGIVRDAWRWEQGSAASWPRSPFRTSVDAEAIE